MASRPKRATRAAPSKTRSSQRSRTVTARAAKAATVRSPRAVAAHKSRPNSASTTYVWRRLHDGSLIAEASPVRGMGAWRVCAYPTANSGEGVTGPQAFSFLRDAHAAADDLLRRHFSHTCRTGVCGRWLRWVEV